jgi:GST-like protein
VQVIEGTDAVIDLYSWPTPNGFKVSILLEELGLPYRAHAVDIGSGEQFEADFLAISPNNKIPALVDPEGPDGKPYSLFESGAILMYLADKHGRFWPRTHPGHWDTVKWLMFQMGGFGPMLGQAHHFRIYAPEKIEYAVNRYTNEAGRLYGVLDKRLGEAEFMAGDDYTIADIATFPWTRSIQNQGHALEDFPNVKRWHDAIAGRPAVQRGVEVLADRRKPLTDDKTRETLFGSGQSRKR